MGLKGDLLNLIVSLLFERVVLNGQESVRMAIKASMPLDSILRPLFF